MHMLWSPTKRNLACACALALMVSITGCSEKNDALTPANFYQNCYAPIEHYNAINKGPDTFGFAHIQRSNNASDRRIMYVSTMDAYIDTLDLEATIARSAAKCYDDNFNTALNDVKSGRLSKSDFLQRYTEITSGMTEATGVLGSILQKAKSVSQQYDQNYTQESSLLKLTPHEIQAMLYVNSQTAKAKSDRRLVKSGSPVPVGPAPKDEFGKVKTTWADTDSVTKKVSRTEYKQLSEMAERSEHMDYFIWHLETEQKMYVHRIQQMHDQKTSLGL